MRGRGRGTGRGRGRDRVAEGDLGLVGEDGGAARAPLGVLLADTLLREGLDLELLPLA